MDVFNKTQKKITKEKTIDRIDCLKAGFPEYQDTPTHVRTQDLYIH